MKHLGFPWKYEIFNKYWEIDEKMCGSEEVLYESSVRKLGWRFTARLPYQNSIELGQSGAAHAGSFDHEKDVLE